MPPYLSNPKMPYRRSKAKQIGAAQGEAGLGEAGRGEAGRGAARQDEGGAGHPGHDFSFRISE